MVTDDRYGEHSVTYRLVELLCCIPETNVTCVNYTSIKIKIRYSLIKNKIPQILLCSLVNQHLADILFLKGKIKIPNKLMACYEHKFLL